jgi:hypothetical protein
VAPYTTRNGADHDVEKCRNILRFALLFGVETRCRLAWFPAGDGAMRRANSIESLSGEGEVAEAGRQFLRASESLTQRRTLAGDSES